MKQQLRLDRSQLLRDGYQAAFAIPGLNRFQRAEWAVAYADRKLAEQAAKPKG